MIPMEMMVLVVTAATFLIHLIHGETDPETAPMLTLDENRIRDVPHGLTRVPLVDLFQWGFKVGVLCGP